MTMQRSTDHIASEIRGLLDEDPQWVDFEGRDDQLVGYLLRDGMARHIPRDLLWEYTAARWQELYAPEEEGIDS